MVGASTRPHFLIPVNFLVVLSILHVSLAISGKVNLLLESILSTVPRRKNLVPYLVSPKRID